MSKSRQPTTTETESLPEVSERTKPMGVTLAEMRANATARAAEATHDLARTIADLEAWRSEIDATIAFLKAQRR